MSLGRDFIGPFQLLRLIRAGTTTQVWEALRSGENERIALKVLMESFRKDKYEVGQLKHEAVVGTDLDHPNVIKIFGYHEDQGYPLISDAVVPLAKPQNRNAGAEGIHDAQHFADHSKLCLGTPAHASTGLGSLRRQT